MSYILETNMIVAKSMPYSLKNVQYYVTTLIRSVVTKLVIAPTSYILKHQKFYWSDNEIL